MHLAASILADKEETDIHKQTFCHLLSPDISGSGLLFPRNLLSITQVFCLPAYNHPIVTHHIYPTIHLSSSFPCLTCRSLRKSRRMENDSPPLSPGGRISTNRTVNIPYDVLREFLEAEVDEWFAERGLDSKLIAALVSLSFSQLLYNQKLTTR